MMNVYTWLTNNAIHYKIRNQSKEEQFSTKKIKFIQQEVQWHGKIKMLELVGLKYRTGHIAVVSSEHVCDLPDAFV